jgi:hypothetical protein
MRPHQIFIGLDNKAFFTLFIDYLIYGMNIAYFLG